MGKISNNSRITAHLQRIFIYGDEVAKAHRHADFIKYVSERGVKLDGKSLYRYIAGEQHYPVDLLNLLAEWSADAKLMADYSISPSPSSREKLAVQLSEIETSIEKQREAAKKIKDTLKTIGRK